MSGVFGVVDPNQKLNVRRMADRMASSMAYRDWYETDLYYDEQVNLAVGRIGIVIINSDSQPLINESGVRILFMSGEI